MSRSRGPQELSSPPSKTSSTGIVPFCQVASLKEKRWRKRGPLRDSLTEHITDYGYGWFVGNLQGSRLVEHGGNMGGFMSHSILSAS